MMSKNGKLRTPHRRSAMSIMKPGSAVINTTQFRAAGEALHSCPLLKEEQTTARRLSKSANAE
jgi:hypothetical protein